MTHDTDIDTQTANATLWLSVVVPTHDRRDSVLRLLAALALGGCAPAHFEAIVAVDGASDGTADAVRALDLPFAVRVVEQSPARGAASARNLGAAAARGEVLLFVDDDIEPLPGSLALHLRAHAEHRERHGDAEPLVVVGAPIPVRSATDGFHALAIWGWWEQQFERMSRPRYRMRYDDVYSGVLSMPASLFAAVGGFETGLPSSCRDDSELGLRLLDRGARVAFMRAAGGLHHEMRDRTRLVARKRAEGRADVVLARLHPELWPSLRIAAPEPPRASKLGAVRRAAFTMPGIGDAMARAASRALDLVEALRLRSTWRALNAAVMYYWYWRGVRDEVGGRAALATLAERSLAAPVQEAAPLALDLSDGVDAAASRVDVERPVAVELRYAGLPVGRMDPVAGAERLRGVHLRAALAGPLGPPLLAALALDELSPRAGADGAFDVRD